MFFLLLSFLVLALSTALFFKRYRLAMGVALFSVLFIFCVGTGFVPSFLLAPLQKREALFDHKWAPRNVIVLLGSGSVRWAHGDRMSTHSLGYSRIHEAARLYQMCKKEKAICHILVSGGDPQKNKTTEAEIMKRELVEIGAMGSDVILENKSNNTFQNAQFSSELIKSGKYDQTILVTSGLHMSRSLLYFSNFGINAVAAPSDELHAFRSFFPVAHNFTLADLAFHEHLGVFRFHFYNLMGWNSRSAHPGSP